MKIKLTLKCLGLLFILPLCIAVVLCAVAFGFAVHQYGIVSVGALVTLAAALGFIAVIVTPFALFYSRFYSRIDDIVDLGDGVTCYVISNGLLKNVGPNAVKCTLVECLKRAYEAFCAVGYSVTHAEVKAPLADFFVVFVADIDEMAYYQRWGIKYKGIAGLKMSNRVLVVKQYAEALDATALEHEIFHVIVDAHDADLRAIGKLADVEDALGLEHNYY